jgi:hypothetical protein
VCPGIGNQCGSPVLIDLPGWVDGPFFLDLFHLTFGRWKNGICAVDQLAPEQKTSWSNEIIVFSFQNANITVSRKVSFLFFTRRG